MLAAALCRWRERDRAELKMLIRQGFDFSDMGVTLALAAGEAEKWPWEQWGPDWVRVASMNDRAVALRPACPDDLPFILATERLPGFDQMVGRWTEDEHRAALGQPNYIYLLGSNAGKPVAFAIIRDIDDAHGNVCLKRIAVASPGMGFGSAFLGLVADWVFSETSGYRLWLDVLADNARARHVYLSHGFVEEGLLRGAYKLPDDRRIDLVLMSLTRPGWLARRCEGAD